MALLLRLVLVLTIKTQRTETSMIIVNQIRTHFGTTWTQSDLYINGRYFCKVLEDAARPAGVKIYGDTCIPEGLYDCITTKSLKYNKLMLQLRNAPNNEIRGLNITWTGVRPHGGNDIDDTLGCPLVAKHTDNKGKVWGSMSQELFNALAHKTVLWIISSDNRVEAVHI